MLLPLTADNSQRPSNPRSSNRQKSGRSQGRLCARTPKKTCWSFRANDYAGEKPRVECQAPAYSMIAGRYKGIWARRGASWKRCKSINSKHARPWAHITEVSSHMLIGDKENDYPCETEALRLKTSQMSNTRLPFSQAKSSGGRNSKSV